MTSVPMTHVLMLALVLMGIGLAGVLARRNAIFMLLSVEIMLNAAGLAFVGAGACRAQAEGQLMFILILAMAGAEVSVGLALILLIRSMFHTLDADAISKMKG